MSRNFGLRPRGLARWDRLPDYHIPTFSKEPAWLAWLVIGFAGVGVLGSALLIFTLLTGLTR